MRIQSNKENFFFFFRKNKKKERKERKKEKGGWEERGSFAKWKYSKVHPKASKVWGTYLESQ